MYLREDGVGLAHLTLWFLQWSLLTLLHETPNTIWPKSGRASPRGQILTRTGTKNHLFWGCLFWCAEAELGRQPFISIKEDSIFKDKHEAQRGEEFKSRSHSRAGSHEKRHQKLANLWGSEATFLGRSIWLFLNGHAILLLKLASSLFLPRLSRPSELWNADGLSWRSRTLTNGNSFLFVCLYWLQHTAAWCGILVLRPRIEPRLQR